MVIVTTTIVKSVLVLFLMLSVASMVSLVNIQYSFANNLDKIYLVSSIDVITEMQYKPYVYSAVATAAPITNTTTSIHNNDDNDDDNIITTISGDAAKKMIQTLSSGTMIHFKVVTDGNGNEIVELSEEY